MYTYVVHLFADGEDNIGRFETMRCTKRMAPDTIHNRIKAGPFPEWEVVSIVETSERSGRGYLWCPPQTPKEPQRIR